LRDRLSYGIGSLFQKNSGSSDTVNELLALQDVTFDIMQGEIVGIIGRNGAGKSTLLKILSRITEPSTGRTEIYGRVGSLLEVGTGFHPELSGRENIYLNGAILGMTQAEVKRNFDEIVAFAEIEKFLDTPVKRYSSGMYVRLAFSVAAHLDPEVLVVDEVLAVGDVAFQRKCLGKMGEVASGGRTILFVSHNMGVIQSLCNRAITLREGSVIFDGSVDEAVGNYLSSMTTTTTNNSAFSNNPERSGKRYVQLTAARILDDSGRPSLHLVSGKQALFEFSYENPSQVNQAVMVMAIYNFLGAAVTNFDMRLTDDVVQLGTRGKFACKVPGLPLPLGQYRVAVALYVDGEIVDHIPNALVFDVDSSTFYKSGKTPSQGACACMVDHSWAHEIS
jgi:lipopolysaccharide transport system ATP-binding protein